MRFIKGAFVVIFACSLLVSSILVIVTTMGMLSGNMLGDVNQNFMFVAKNWGIVFVSLIALYYLQQPNNQSVVQASFRKKKWLVGILVILCLLVIPLLASLPPLNYVIEHLLSLPNYGKYAIYALIVLAFLVLIGIAKLVWRCPSCGNQLPFLKMKGGGLEISVCPFCRTKLG